MYLLGFKGTALWKTEKRLISGRNYLKGDLSDATKKSPIYLFSAWISTVHGATFTFVCATQGLGTAAQKRDGKMTLSEESCTHLIPDSNKSLTAEINPCADSNLSSAVVLTVGATHATFSFLLFCSGAEWFKGLIFHGESPLLESSTAPSTKHEKPNIDSIKIIMQWHIFKS